MNECDFCLTESEHLISVNGGLWAICSICNDYVHLQMTIINKNKEKKEPCVCDGGTRRIPGCCKLVVGEEE